MAKNQALPPIHFKVGDRVRISYVPSAILNVSLGTTGTVVRKPQIVAQMVQMKIKLDDGQEITWLQDYLKKIEPDAEKSHKNCENKPELEQISAKADGVSSQEIAGVSNAMPNETRLSIQIDPEFKSLIPPLSSEERAQLEENLLREGCRDPLVIWRSSNILLDGHNRYEVCTRHGISFNLVSVDLPDREAAIDWLIDQQLGRRNLTPEAISYLRGKRYNREKTAGHGAKTGGQNGTQIKTAERLANEYKVGSRTVKRDGQFADAVDTLAFVVGNEIRPSILSRDAKLTKKQTKELAQSAKQNPEILKEEFNTGGEILDVVERIKRKADERANLDFPFRVGEVCLIQPQGDKDLRQYKGCWCIIKEIHNYSCTVIVWNREIQLSEKNINSLEYTEQEKEEKRALALRLQRIKEAGGMDEAVVRSNLEFFGRLERSYLSSVEDGLLNWIEKATLGD